MTTADLSTTGVATREIELHLSLLADDAPVLLHLPSLLSPTYTDEVTKVLRSLSLKPYDATVGSELFAPIPKLGPALFEYHDVTQKSRTAGLSEYFDQAARDSMLLRNAFASHGVPDPLEVIHEIAGRILGAPVSVAREWDREYFSGVVRDINAGALPHYDDASVDTPDLEVGQTDRQLSILLYMTDFLGGGLTSFSKKPSAHDNAHHQLGYGYTSGAVQGAEFQGVLPSKGSVVIFNPRFLHAVAPIQGDQRRLTVSSFIGRRVADGALISWS